MGIIAKKHDETYQEYRDLTIREWWTTSTQAAKFGLVDGIVSELYYTALPPKKEFSLFEFSQEKEGNTVRHPAR